MAIVLKGVGDIPAVPGQGEVVRGADPRHGPPELLLQRLVAGEDGPGLVVLPARDQSAEDVGDEGEELVVCAGRVSCSVFFILQWEIPAVRRGAEPMTAPETEAVELTARGVAVAAAGDGLADHAVCPLHVHVAEVPEHGV